MKILFSKESHERYSLRIVRDDGTETSAESIEARSVLKHDLMHYCVEKNAGLIRSFFGSLAAGVNLSGLRMEGQDEVLSAEEGSTTELVVAILQNALRDGRTPADFAASICGALEAVKKETPAYLTEEFIEKTLKEHRLLMMRWEGVRPGEELGLLF
jgi:hypothetical protein